MLAQEECWLFGWGCLLSNWRLSDETESCFPMLSHHNQHEDNQHQFESIWQLEFFFSLQGGVHMYLYIYIHNFPLKKSMGLGRLIIEISRITAAKKKTGWHPDKAPQGETPEATWQGVFFYLMLLDWLTRICTVDFKWIEWIDFEWLVTGLHPRYHTQKDALSSWILVVDSSWSVPKKYQSKGSEFRLISWVFCKT